MAEKAGGFAKVVTSSALVVHVYETFLENVSATPFSDGEALSWSGGTGTCIDFEPTTGRLSLTRSTGTAPAIGATITGGGSGATGDVADFGDHDPPAWDTKIPDPSANVVTFHVEGDVNYDSQVASRSADLITLAAPWAGATVDEAVVSIASDQTLLGEQLYGPGEAALAQKLTRDAMERARRLRPRWATATITGSQPLSSPGENLGNGVTLARVPAPAGGRLSGDEDWIDAANDALKVPAGVVGVQLFAGIRMQTDAQDFAVLFTLNGADAQMSGRTTSGSGNSYEGTTAQSGILRVAEDDLLRCYVAVPGDLTIDEDSGSGVYTWFMARVVEVA